MRRPYLSSLFLIASLASTSSHAAETYNRQASCFTRALEAIRSSSREGQRETKARQIADLIAVDEETQRLVSDPKTAQYVYLNYFADDADKRELSVALQDLADSDKAQSQGLYELVNRKLAARLNDPEVQAKVKAAIGEDDRALRPSKLRTKLFNAKARMNQIAHIPQTIARIKKQSETGLSREMMNRGLFDFYGATQLGLPESQLRPWANIPEGYSTVGPDQIENMSPQLWGRLVRFASETEAPIHGYSDNSGELFRAAFPSLAAFTGKTSEQAQAFEAKASSLSEGERTYGYCTNVWCKEEKRHEATLGRLADRVLGMPKTTPNTYSAAEHADYSDVDSVLFHMMERNAGEWNANSAYLMLGAHARGAANQWLDNIRRDETKHLAIFTAFWKYIYGPEANKRTQNLFKTVLTYRKEAATANSSGDVLSPVEAPTLLESAISYLFVEKQARDYFKNVPLKTLEKIFESPVKTIKSIESLPVSPEKQKGIDEVAAREKESRAGLRRWNPEERKKYLALKRVEKEQGPLIESLIANVFDGFHGAEEPGSAREKNVLAQIGQLRTGLAPETNSLIQLSLRETLQDYQIMNNSFVRSRKDLVVRLKNAREGFVVEHAAPDEAKVLLSKRLTDSSYMVRVEKPAGMTFGPGDAVRITVDTPNGKQARTLSLASSPMRDYLDFAVRDSDSDFKKAFAALKPGTRVKLEPAKGAMDFKPDAPAVMIAGGIGITPFRSMIQFAKDAKHETPMWLIYGNRDQIPFKSELDEHAAAMPRLNVTHVLSKPDQTWNGERGRIDEAFLKKTVAGLPANAQYYLVGPPAMVIDSQAALTRLGIPKERISIEVFPESAGEGSQSPPKGAEGADDPKVCFCHSVPRGRIREAVRNGAKTLADIQSQTMAATACGGCQCNVMDILECESKAAP